MLLDTVNRRLLAELDSEPRITMSALARRVGMSAPAVSERVQRLERAGVITGYRTQISPAALGLPVTAFVRIRPTAGQLPRIAELAAATPEVSECHRISGEDCFLIKLHAGAIEDLATTLAPFRASGQPPAPMVVSPPGPPLGLPITGGPRAGTGLPPRPAPRLAGRSRPVLRVNPGAGTGATCSPDHLGQDITPVRAAHL